MAATNFTEQNGSRGVVDKAVRDADWQRILRVIGKAYADYLTGMATLRKRVVADVKHKVDDDRRFGSAHLERGVSAPEGDPDEAGQAQPRRTSRPRAAATADGGGERRGSGSGRSARRQ